MTQSSSGTEGYTQDINNNFAAAKAAIANLASNTAPSSLIQTVNGKQDALTEGPGINISGNTISVSTTIASKTDIGNGATVFKNNGTAFATITANQTSTVDVDFTIPAMPTIATSVSASSTNAETVGAKLFYDTLNGIETLLQGV